MFVTMPTFEFEIPAGTAPKGTRAWLAMTLSMESAWFLAKVRVDVADDFFVQTTAIAWESRLLEIVQGEVGTLISLDCLVPSDEDGEWVIEKISELWLPADDEVEATGPMLYAVRGETELIDCFRNRHPNTGKQRELVIRLPS